MSSKMKEIEKVYAKARAGGGAKGEGRKGGKGAGEGGVLMRGRLCAGSRGRQGQGSKGGRGCVFCGQGLHLPSGGLGECRQVLVGQRCVCWPPKVFQS